MNFSHVDNEDSSLLMESTKLSSKKHKIFTSEKKDKASQYKT